MANITINGKDLTVPDGITIIQACEHTDVEIPRFCYHERLSIAGNCRMCLVEVEGMPPKPVASCAMPVTEGMKIHTDSPMVKKAREGVMEFLLANHPLDCPICDQGGECDLQDQAFAYGSGKSEYHEHKRSVKDKNMGPLIKTQMTRCIHCTRCVRFIEDVAGTVEIGAVGRGETMEITTYLEKSVASELSGNVIDLCPVGALTSKPYAFKARSWELKKTESVDVMDAVGSNIRIDSRGMEVMRILPRLNEEINEEWISDKSRFCYDGLKYQRLDKAYVKQNGQLQESELNQAYDLVAQKLKNTNPSEVVALSGNLAAVEDIFSLKTLLEKLQITNFDCRISEQKIDASDRASYLFNSAISGIDEAEACLLVGVNPRKDAPILNARIRKRWLSKKLKVAAIGLDADLTYSYEKLGNEAQNLQDILDEKSAFAQVLKNAQKALIIVGEDAVSGDNGQEIMNLAKKVAEKFSLVSESWNGFNFLAKSTGLINGLELGFTSAKGAANMLKNPESKVVILQGVDDSINFESLKGKFVIYLGSHGDQGANYADVILPTTAYSERNAFYINLEGRIQETKRAVFGPDLAKDNWEIIVELANKIGVNIGFSNLNELRVALASKHAIFNNVSEITKAAWKKSEDKNLAALNENLSAKDYNFYLTNYIARSSRTLNQC